MSQRTTGRVLGVDQSTIARIERLPEVQARIAELGAMWQVATQMHIARAATGVMDMLGEAMENRDAPGLGAISRGVLALEKVSACTDEIRQRVDGRNVSAPQTPKADFTALFATVPGEIFSRQQVSRVVALTSDRTLSSLPALPEPLSVRPKHRAASTKGAHIFD